MVDLIGTDGMSEAGVQAHGDISANSCEDLAGLDHALLRYVRVDITAAEKHRGSSEVAGIIARSSRGTDQAAAQADDSPVPARVAGGKLQREAGALRETEQHNVLCRQPVLDFGQDRGKNL